VPRDYKEAYITVEPVLVKSPFDIKAEPLKITLTVPDESKKEKK